MSMCAGPCRRTGGLRSSRRRATSGSRPSDVLIWRLGAPVTGHPAGADWGRARSAIADLRSRRRLRTDRLAQLVRIRLSDATVERRLHAARTRSGPEQSETAERLVGSPRRPCRRDRALDGSACVSFIREPGGW